MPSENVLHKFKRGTLRSGNKRTGPKVKSRSQAIAIKLSEERAEKEGHGHGRKKGRRGGKRR